MKLILIILLLICLAGCATIVRPCDDGSYPAVIGGCGEEAAEVPRETPRKDPADPVYQEMCRESWIHC